MILDFRFLPVIVKQALNISCGSIWILPLESLWFVLFFFFFLPPLTIQIH